MASYHHLDVSATLSPTKMKIKTGRRMGFSIYNIYNRKNAASINFRQNENTGANEAVKHPFSNCTSS
jgi:hypothetical protein